MPKYRIDPIPGMPTWFVPGIVCKVRDKSCNEWANPRPIYCFYSGVFRDNNMNPWRFAEPVEEWEPQEGEWVAQWFGVDNHFRVVRYSGSSTHYVRLVYPDGRVIDCACDVETLKTRTDWI